MLASALLGAFIAHGLVLLREGTERKRRFRAAVELIRFEIESAPKDLIWRTHENSIHTLQEQAAHVLLDVQVGQQEAFRENLIRYSKLTSGDVPGFINADAKSLNPQYEAAVVAIIDPLANLIEIVGEQANWLATKANKAARASSPKQQMQQSARF